MKYIISVFFLLFSSEDLYDFGRTFSIAWKAKIYSSFEEINEISYYIKIQSNGFIFSNY